MSWDSSLEEDGINYNQDSPEPLSDVSYELFAACQRPCKVVLERLSEEEIQHHLSIVDDRWNRPVRTQKQIARNYLKDVPRVDFGLFAQYKRSRQKFINKQNSKHVSAEIGDFGFSSSEDFQLPSDEDYVPEVSNKRKRKRLAYEEDYDWNPASEDGWVPPRPKKTLRNLRVNTRRKRIESNSSASSDEDFEKISETRTAFESVTAESTGDAFLEMKKSPKKEPSEEAGFSAASLLDSDLLSQIMQEMEDFNRKKGSKSLKSSTEDGKELEAGFSGVSRQKRRVSRVIKITDDLTPTIRHVQQVVKNMVNTVCSFERQRELAMEETKKRPCKWCDSLFLPRSKDEELCKICKDVVKLSSTPKTSNKRGPKLKGVGSKPGAKSKIKSKVLKNLPKYEQRRLMYGEKVSNNVKNSANQQDYVENNLTMIAAEIHPEPPSSLKVTNPAKKRKLKNNSNLSAAKTKVIKTKKKKLDSINAEGLASLKPIPKKLTVEKKNHVVDKNSKNGLLRIDFPDAEASGTLGTSANLSSHTIATKEAAANNVQYGTYLLPPIPTVVVANYAATDAKSGDYYLSSVYYQNEMTQAKNAPGRNENAATNIAAAKVNSLPSMPSMDQLSISFLDQLPNIPSLSFSQSGNMDTFPNAGYGVEAKVVDNKSLTNQQQVPFSNPYSLDHDISLLLNNPNLQIQPVEPMNSNVTTESDIASLFSNPHLQIEPLLPSDGMQYESFEPDRHHEESNDGAPCVENENQPVDMPSKELGNSKSAQGDKAVDDSTVAPKPAKNQKETKQQLKDKKQESNKNLSEEPSEEDMSSEALFRKMSTELDAIGILGVVDLDKSPRFSLERIMETNKTQFEQLQGMKPMTKDVKLKLKQAEDNRTTLHLAKTLLNTFGSFSKLSNSCLMHAKILQIKKEKNLEQEETRSSCQFSQSQSVPAYIDIMGQQGIDLDQIMNIESPISSIPAADPSLYGTVHHFPAPSSIPRSESRETPSRGSGPLTPARPESAMSQAEEPALTPLQIKKERIEASNSSSPRSFATQPVVSHQLNAINQSNPPAYVSHLPQQQAVHLNQPQQQAIHINQPQQQAIHINQPQQQAIHLNQPQQQATHISNQLQQQANQTSMAIPTSEDTFHILNEMTQRLHNVGQSSSQLRNVTIAPSNQPQLRNMTIAPSNNQQMHSMMHFQGRPSGPPNVTVPPNNNNQNVSKVLLNFAARQQSSPSSNPNMSNANYIIKNGQINIQHRNSPNTQTLSNPNVMFKNTQMVNVQQVYLPSSQQRFQPANPGMNQFNLVQQGQMVPSQGQQVLVNSAGQGGYSFQGQQQMLTTQQQAPRVSNMNPQLQQHSQGVQPSANQAFLMQNNNRPSPLGSEVPMFCALCGKPATLRCKQCAKIAYCDTKCAKTYWHSRHKSECKQMVN